MKDRAPYAGVHLLVVFWGTVACFLAPYLSEVYGFMLFRGGYVKETPEASGGFSGFCVSLWSPDASRPDFFSSSEGRGRKQGQKEPLEEPDHRDPPPRAAASGPLFCCVPWG